MDVYCSAAAAHIKSWVYNIIIPETDVGKLA